MLDRLAQTPSGKLMDEKGNADARKRRHEVLQHLDQSPRFTKQGESLKEKLRKQRKILPENIEKLE